MGENLDLDADKASLGDGSGTGSRKYEYCNHSMQVTNFLRDCGNNNGKFSLLRACVDDAPGKFSQS